MLAKIFVGWYFLGRSWFSMNWIHNFKFLILTLWQKISSEVTDFLQGPDGNSATSKVINWHMIGHLQRNKVRQVLPIAVLIHSVDTLRLAEEINAAATKLDSRPKVLLQVNCSNESQKYGVPVGAAIHLAEQIETLPNLQLVGLMTMGPLTHNKDIVRASFVRARELFVEMRGEKIVGPHFTELSMGMSSDYEVAVEEGATILRIGSAIFAGWFRIPSILIGSIPPSSNIEKGKK
jgi:pyridoxal phosphate enzyme (YggS family)